MKAFFFTLFLGLLSSQVLSQPVNKDPNVSSVLLSELENFESAEELWQELNRLHFWEIPLYAPDGYYSDIDFSNNESLRVSLHKRIENHRVYPYYHSSVPGDASHRVDTWDILALSDAHPVYKDKVLDIYLNGTFQRQYKYPDISFRYDKEHSWPKSLGFNKETTENPAYSDCHHLFAAFQPYNSSRSNKPFGEDIEALQNEEFKRPTHLNVNRGGEEEDMSNFSSTKLWHTWIGRRGDIARAMFYMDLRYDGLTENSRKEADLHLTDDITLIEKNNNAWMHGENSYMGLKTVLLKWHREDPVDDLERRRNTVVYLFQGNRNPFIDFPEWAESVFSTVPAVAASMPVIWINEFHYDNVGTDTNEFIEIAGMAGTDLTGWYIAAYNGANGLVYRVLPLSGKIDDENASGYGALSFDVTQLQNGPADGFALVSSLGRSLQFLTYEGILTAGNGASIGEISENLQVSESESTPVGFSIQLKGSGNKYKSFRWEGPMQSSPGNLNNDQIIQDNIE